MRCYHCGQEIQDDVTYCAYCGAHQGAGATVVLDQVFNPHTTESENSGTDALSHSEVQANNSVQANAPKIQFNTNRGLLKMLLLGLVTCGIYNIVIWSKIITELNVVACRHDGKRTMPFLDMVTLSPLTFGILPFVWYHKLCGRIGDELKRRRYNYTFSSADFWLWNVLGSFIFVGPFVFTHKIMKAMNLINSDFNTKE